MIITTLGKRKMYKFRNVREAINTVKRCATIEEAAQRKNAA